MPKQKAKVAGRRKPTADAATRPASPEVAPGRTVKSKPARKLKSSALRGVAASPQDAQAVALPPVKQKSKPSQPSRPKLRNKPTTTGLLRTLISSVTRQPDEPAAQSGRLERLERAILDVKEGTHTSPRTRKLLASGIPKMAQKVIEEAAEVAIEAIRADRTALVHESVDLFYNLTVLWSSAGVSLADIWTEMDRREATLGMAEKLPKVLDDE